MHLKFSRVYIEISNICNLQCSFCPEVERQKKVMKYELFTKIIGELSGMTEEVTFHLMGEPLAHPQFTQFLNFCQKVSMPVNLTTNGTLIHKKHIMDSILNSSVRQINFSLQSLSSNFSVEMANHHFAQILNFVREIRQKRSDMYVNFRLWNKGSEEDLNTDNHQFLKPLKDEYGLPLSNSIDLRRQKSIRIVDRIYLHFDSRFEWPALAQPFRSTQGYCYGLKSHIGIHADGTVVPCCLDKEAVLNLGQVIADEHSIESLKQILSSKRAQSIRQGFAQYQLVEKLCQKCDFIKRFDSKVPSKNRVIKNTVDPLTV